MVASPAKQSQAQLEKGHCAVNVHNDLPGVETFSSCGGHSPDACRALKISQVPDGNWYVHFAVDESPGAWRSLASVARATQFVSSTSDCDHADPAGNTGEGEPVVLQVFVDDTGALSFEIRGRGVAADVVADALSPE
jgi:hypothetical protein